MISPTERKYVKELISFINTHSSFEKNSVVEIGCGLGDIIRRLDFKNKIGYDGEINVIKAARCLSQITNDKTRFAEFVFPSSKLNGSFDTILMVNWIHHIGPEVLKKFIELFFIENLNAKGCVIIDTVQAKSYKYNHNIDFLTSGIPCSIVKIGNYENQREIYAIFK